MLDITEINHVDGYYSHAAFPSTVFESFQKASNDQNEYSFLRLPIRHIDTMVDDGYEPIYETIHFSDISSTFEQISGLTNHQCENDIEPSALVAPVSYDNGDDTISWIIEIGSTHLMNFST